MCEMDIVCLRTYSGLFPSIVTLLANPLAWIFISIKKHKVSLPKHLCWHSVSTELTTTECYEKRML